MFLVVAVLCHCQLFGLSGVDVLVVFFHHVFNGLGSLYDLDLATSLGNTVYTWHNWSQNVIHRAKEAGGLLGQEAITFNVMCGHDPAVVDVLGFMRWMSSGVFSPWSL
jgi:hypothetical protein